MSRVGTLSVCIMAKEFNIPVIVAAETYKFSNVLRLDSLSWNEMGDQDELVEGGKENLNAVKENWASIPHLNILNLHYDLTPPKFVTMVN